jgi:serine/threonine protein kinase
MYEKFTLEDKKKFFTGLLNLFDGLQFFIENDIIHYDIKANNIVYNIHTGTAKFIDFGLANKISVVIEKCKKDNNWLAVSHGYYPKESSCMNKSKFLFSNKTHCKKLREAFQNNYDDFIKTATHSFDMYSLCYALDRLFEDLKDFERALRGKTEVYNFLDAGLFQLRSNRAMPLQFRNANPTELKEKLKDLLEVYNLYDVDKPVPSVELKELSNKHSYPLNVDRKCPSSKPDYNPKTKKCVAKCKGDKVRNENFRCVAKKKSTSLKPQNEISQSLKPQNEILQSMNSTRRRYASYSRMSNNKNNTTKKCSSDKILNPKTKRCVKKCKPNQTRNKDFRCVSKKNKKAALDMSLL